MPEKLHIEKTKYTARRIVVGDIHGCFKTLKYLVEEKINLSENDQLFLCGDLIHRGPSAGKVVSYIIGLQRAGYNVYSVRGNHDELLLYSYDAPGFNYQSYINAYPGDVELFTPGKKVIPHFYVWLKELPYYITTDNTIVVHAGINFKADEPFKDFDAMLWQRNRRYTNDDLNGHRIIAGHYVHRFEDIEQAVDSKAIYIPVDNGCVYANRGKEGIGSLIAVDMDSLQIYSKECIDDLPEN